MVPRLEALADAIMEHNGSRDPASSAYQNRNPLFLNDYHCKRQDLRIFPTFRIGYHAALYDLYFKCSGKTRAKLPSHDLVGLVRVFSMPDIAANKISKFLRAALIDNNINAETPLEYFLL